MSSTMIACHSIIRQASEAYFRSVWVEAPSIIYVRQGSKYIETDDSKIRITENQAVIFSPGQILGIKNRPDENADYLADVFTFDAELVKKCYSSINAQAPANSNFSAIAVNTEMQNAFSKAKQDLIAQEIPDNIIQHRATELLLWLSESGVYFRIANEPTIHDRVRKLLLSDLARNWRAQEVAQHMAMSEQSLRRHLAEMNTTFKDILTEARLGRALDLLQTTTLPVTEIAYEIGYGSPSSFTERFKSRFEIPPTAIRKKLI